MSSNKKEGRYVSLHFDEVLLSGIVYHSVALEHLERGGGPVPLSLVMAGFTFIAMRGWARRKVGKSAYLSEYGVVDATGCLICLMLEPYVFGSAILAMVSLHCTMLAITMWKNERIDLWSAWKLFCWDSASFVFTGVWLAFCQEWSVAWVFFAWMAGQRLVGPFWRQAEDQAGDAVNT